MMVEYNGPFTRTQKLYLNGIEVTGSALEINRAVQVTKAPTELTETGDVTPGVQAIELSHATVIIEAAIADLADHAGKLTIKDTSASGTAAHTVTLTAGTFNGTNKIATFNAPGEAIVIEVDSAGNGIVVLNAGVVVFSGT